MASFSIKNVSAEFDWDHKIQKSDLQKMKMKLKKKTAKYVKYGNGSISDFH